MSVSESWVGPIKRSLSFRGRTSRSEYTKVYVGLLVVGVALKAISTAPVADTAIKVLGPCLVIPVLGSSTRRLHDTSRSGATLWLGLIPIAGTILLMLKLFEPGSEGPNRYGAPPPRPDGERTIPPPVHRRTYLAADGTVLRSEIVDEAGNVLPRAPGTSE